MLVVLIILKETCLHAAMVACDTDGCILIKILLFDPFHEIKYLTGRTRPYIRISIPVSIRAQFTQITAAGMCVNRKHGKIKRLSLHSKRRQLFLRVFIQSCVFKPPAFFIIVRNSSLCNSAVIVPYLIIPMLCKIILPPRIRKIGPCKEKVMIPLFLKNFTKRRKSGHKGSIFAHRIINASGIILVLKQFERHS